MFLSMLPSIAAGTLAAFLIVSRVLMNEDPYQRVAIMYTILAADMMASVLSFVLFSNAVFLFISIFALTKCITWVTLIDPEYIVHHQLEE